MILAYQQVRAQRKVIQSSWKFNCLYEPTVNAKLTFLVLILIPSFLSFFLTLTLDISGTRYYNKMKLTLA